MGRRSRILLPLLPRNGKCELIILLSIWVRRLNPKFYMDHVLRGWGSAGYTPLPPTMGGDMGSIGGSHTSPLWAPEQV